MTDFADQIFRTAIDSDIVRTRPNTLVQLYLAGTETLQAEGLTDARGYYSIATLPTGQYDIRIDGQSVHTAHFVNSKADRSWTCQISGAFTGDVNETQNHQVFYAPAAGKVIAVNAILERIADGGNVTAHILKGAVNGSAGLTVASNSVWSHQFTNSSGSTKYRVPETDAAPGIDLAAGDAVTIGIDHTANGAEGLTLEMTFRPNP